MPHFLLESRLITLLLSFIILLLARKSGELSERWGQSVWMQFSLYFLLGKQSSYSIMYRRLFTHPAGLLTTLCI